MYCSTGVGHEQEIFFVISVIAGQENGFVPVTFYKLYGCAGFTLLYLPASQCSSILPAIAGLREISTTRYS
jgi:hypothetical protein